MRSLMGATASGAHARLRSPYVSASLLLAALFVSSAAFTAPLKPAISTAESPARVSLHGDGLYGAGLIQGSGAPALGVPALRAALEAYRRDLGADDPSALRCAVSLAPALRLVGFAAARTGDLNAATQLSAEPLDAEKASRDPMR